MAHFLISKKSNGEYYFSLAGSNGAILITSEGYSRKDKCLQGIASVKVNAVNSDRYDRRESRDGRYYFSLKAGNGEVLATSEYYASMAGRENGIVSTMHNAPSAIVAQE